MFTQQQEGCTKEDNEDSGNTTRMKHNSIVRDRHTFEHLGLF